MIVSTDATLRYRSHIQWLLTLVAFLCLFIVLSLPNRLDWVTATAFLFLPLEFILICSLLLVPGRVGKGCRVLLALLLGLSMTLRVADLITHELFARPFNPIFDSHLLADASRLLTGILGRLSAFVIGLVVMVLASLLCWLVFAMLGRIQRTLQATPRLASTGILVLLLAWCLLRFVGWPRADTFAWDQLVSHAQETLASIRDINAFAATVDEDRYANSSPEQLFSRLRSKDVFIIFAESYGRVLLDNAPFAEPFRTTLTQAEQALSVDGLQVRSAFLSSPTVGGLSWLAHATALSGAWIDSETRYESLIISQRLTLNRLFQQAGWRSVAAMPAITMAWPEGQYFGYDHVYNAHNFGYQGLPYNWVTMPDQYVLSALQAKERERVDRPPLLAEIALISSHAPWTPIASLVPWDAVGDGQIFNAQAQSGPSPETVWQDIATIRSHYRQSIEYMIQTVVSYAQRYADEDLLILIMGDHPPAPLVSGDADSKQVPVHLITRDPALINAIDHWQWQSGLLPDEDAPVWPMDSLRNRFVEAFSEGLGDAE